jgi:signal transduction histidine kinase
MFDISEPINSVSKLLRPLLTRSHIKLQINIMPAIPKALGLPNELKQVLMGLIINSIEAITESRRYEAEELSDEKCKYAGYIAIDAKADDMNIFIEISDDGGGIKPDVMERIFEPHITTKEDKGTGIGLYISKVAMANMNGLISAYNNEKGAVFTMTLCRAWESEKIKTELKV